MLSLSFNPKQKSIVRYLLHWLFHVTFTSSVEIDFPDMQHNMIVQHQVQLTKVRCQLFVFEVECQLASGAIWQVARIRKIKGALPKESSGVGCVYGTLNGREIGG